MWTFLARQKGRSHNTGTIESLSVQHGWNMYAFSQFSHLWEYFCNLEDTVIPHAQSRLCRFLKRYANSWIINILMGQHLIEWEQRGFRHYRQWIRVFLWKYSMRHLHFANYSCYFVSRLTILRDAVAENQTFLINLIANGRLGIYIKILGKKEAD